MLDPVVYKRWTKKDVRNFQQKDQIVKTDTLVAELRRIAALYPQSPSNSVDRGISKTLTLAAQRLDEYEADRVHGFATARDYDLNTIKMQAKLLSDAADIFDQGGSQNTAYWNKHLGEVRREYERGVSTQADDLRSAFGEVEEKGFVEAHYETDGGSPI